MKSLTLTIILALLVGCTPPNRRPLIPGTASGVAVWYLYDGPHVSSTPRHPQADIKTLPCGHAIFEEIPDE